jgi:NADPH:quinone reductase-like Zn-dependent oxidoreductase
MKAVVMDSFGAAEVMRLDDVTPPTPQEHQVLIEVAATSVNRPDIIQRQGHYPPPPGESEILGLECSGRVVAIGTSVTTPAVGDRVFALVGGGAYAELAVADARHCLPIPDRLTFAQAACLAETYITAYLNLFRVARLTDGESVLLHGGGGGVNTAAIALVKALCPESPIVVTASAPKVDRVGALGADLGIMQGSDTALNLGRLMIKRQSVIGSVLRPRPATEKAEIIADFSQTVMPLFIDGRIEPLIDSEWPIDSVVDAHRRMEAGEHFGKIVLIFDRR